MKLFKLSYSIWFSLLSLVSIHYESLRGECVRLGNDEIGTCVICGDDDVPLSKPFDCECTYKQCADCHVGMAKSEINNRHPISFLRVQQSDGWGPMRLDGNTMTRGSSFACPQCRAKKPSQAMVDVFLDNLIPNRNGDSWEADLSLASMVVYWTFEHDKNHLYNEHITQALKSLTPQQRNFLALIALNIIDKESPYNGTDEEISRIGFCHEFPIFMLRLVEHVEGTEEDIKHKARQHVEDLIADVGDEGPVSFLNWALTAKEDGSNKYSGWQTEKIQLPDNYVFKESHVGQR